MLGNKGYVTKRAMVAAINAYGAANPGTRVDISRVKEPDFANSSEERKFYRDLMKDRIPLATTTSWSVNNSIM